MSNPDATRPGLVAAHPPTAWLARMTAAPTRAAGAGAASLDALPTGVPAVVHAVSAPAAAPEWAQWLDEIGFIPGERVMVTARGVPGGDPLVVRVGNSTFALRRAEAACIRLEPAAR
ncbi:MAG: FeoA family protein [Rubrivivax sp.]|nr:FeoA family protein [Rubrivivax sp.]